MPPSTMLIIAVYVFQMSINQGYGQGERYTVRHQTRAIPPSGTPPVLGAQTTDSFQGQVHALRLQQTQGIPGNQDNGQSQAETENIFMGLLRGIAKFFKALWYWISYPFVGGSEPTPVQSEPNGNVNPGQGLVNPNNPAPVPQNGQPPLPNPAGPHVSHPPPQGVPPGAGQNNQPGVVINFKPTGTNAEVVKTNKYTGETFTLFWDSSSIFSNYYSPSPFTLDGVKFDNGEQCFHYKKAILFGDHDSAKKILAALKPDTQKDIGKHVANYNDDTWTAHRLVAMEQCVTAKFEQNPSMKQGLLNTKGTTLVEGSRYDKAWGIGIDMHDPDAIDRRKWKGTNLLGQILQKVRDRFLAGQ